MQELLFSSFVGMIPGILLIFSFIKFRDTRTQFMRMLVGCAVLCIFVNFMYLAGYYLNAYDSPKMCWIFGMIIQWLELSLIIWHFFIHLHSFLTFRLFKQDETIWVEIIYYLVTISVSTTVSFVLLLQKSYGQTNGMWCWINETQGHHRFLYYYIPAWILMICTFLMYSLIFVHRYDLQKSNISPFIKAQMMVRVEYIGIYLLVFLVPYIHRIVEVFFETPLFMKQAHAMFGIRWMSWLLVFSFGALPRNVDPSVIDNLFTSEHCCDYFTRFVGPLLKSENFFFLVFVNEYKEELKKQNCREARQLAHVISTDFLVFDSPLEIKGKFSKIFDNLDSLDPKLFDSVEKRAREVVVKLFKSFQSSSECEKLKTSLCNTHEKSQILFFNIIERIQSLSSPSTAEPSLFNYIQPLVHEYVTELKHLSKQTQIY